MKKIYSFLTTHLMLTTCVLLVLYLILLQNHFFFSGDSWAETFKEYLTDAQTKGWSAVINPSWIGYLSLLPSFFAKLYVSLHLPVGNIDMYYRYLTILYTVICIGFVAHPINRSLIKNDIARILIAFAFIMLYRDVSGFSFINIWYVGFLPVILMSLNPSKLSIRQQSIYTFGGVIASLSKPSTVLIPFIIYRMIRTKEWVSSAILLAAAVFQTWLLYIANAQASSGLLLEIKRMAVIIGVEFLKLFHVMPANIVVALLADVLVAALFVYLWKVKGYIITALLAFGTALAFHTYYIAASGSLFSIPSTSLKGNTVIKNIYDFDLKSQQEIVVGIFFLVILGLIITPLFMAFRRMYIKKYPSKKAKRILVCVSGLLVIGALVSLYQPIDRGRVIDIAAYRHDLTVDTSVCVPMPTLERDIPNPNWYYANNGYCGVENAFSIPNYRSFTVAVDGHQTVIVKGLEGQSLASVLVLVKAKNDGVLHIEDTATHTSYSANYHPMSNGFAYAAFNVVGVGMHDSYRFKVVSSTNVTTTGRFADHDSVAYYPYFIK